MAHELFDEEVAMAGEALQGEVAVAVGKRPRQPPGAQPVRQHVRIDPVGLGQVGAGLLVSVDGTGIEEVDLGSEGRKLRRLGDVEGRTPAVEAGGLQPEANLGSPVRVTSRQA